MYIYNKILESRNKGLKQLAVLIDPDNPDFSNLEKLVEVSIRSKVDYFFVGGSTSHDNQIDKILELLNSQVNIPVVIFPGNDKQIRSNADALLLLSMISGRNPEYLIGQHVQSAEILYHSNIDIIPCGYMLIDGGKMTAVNYVSQTQTIGQDDLKTARNTALAGQFLGLKLIYLEAGSGALNPVNESMINSVSKILDIPLIVGGGINSVDKAISGLRNGADIIVIGNAFEKKPELVKDITGAIQSINSFSIELD
ncbi:MAG: geranylgeranylglyceryl/heptaprenylglyceryl phosphate synthase [Saprospiraceae bacterium]|nr:geranylgeranylglyceryl/heptaprenylglyceryl phosphate synthase [Saprospiraceae bacterium]